MLRHLLAFLWLVTIYLATAINEIISIPMPPTFISELMRMAIHASGHGLLGVLLMWALTGSLFKRERRTVVAIAGMVAVAGLGQEAVQSIYRGMLTPIGSLFDIVVDTAGALLALWVISKLYERITQANTSKYRGKSQAGL